MWMESQNREENMSLVSFPDMTQVTYICTLAHFIPFMHLYLWGAERRDSGSIITA